MCEIRNAMRKLKNNKSCGADNILNEFLKNCIVILCDLFKIVLNTGFVSLEWCTGIIYMIYYRCLKIRVRPLIQIITESNSKHRKIKIVIFSRGKVKKYTIFKFGDSNINIMYTLRLCISRSEIDL